MWVFALILIYITRDKYCITVLCNSVTCYFHLQVLSYLSRIRVAYQPSEAVRSHVTSARTCSTSRTKWKRVIWGVNTARWRYANSTTWWKSRKWRYPGTTAKCWPTNTPTSRIRCYVTETGNNWAKAIEPSLKLPWTQTPRSRNTNQELP